MFKDFPTFTPNVNPEQMIKLGVFGGTYFRPIHSSITNLDYSNAHQEFSWASKVNPDRICNTVYDPMINYYQVKCGTSLEYWESKNWIRAQDPYGWFQWYCRFYQGRRTEDDSRQISRWLKIAGPNGRFYRRSNKSLVVKQVLLNWGVFLG
jgi:hypothetical protein